jgi:putative copper resistance protein D
MLVPSYVSPLDPQHHAVVAAWTFAPFTSAALVLLVVGVLVGMRRTPGWARWRLAPLLAGAALGLVAVDAWPGVYARALASVLVSQQLTLLLVTPVLVAFARPGEPLRALGLRLPFPGALRALGHPLVGPVVVPVVTTALVFTPLFDVAVDSRLGSDLIGLALLAIGGVVAAPLAREDARASSLGVGLVLFVGLVELLVDALPGIALSYSNNILRPVATLASRREWGPSTLHDQHLAGAILWGLAEIVDLPFLLIVLRQWIHADAREAQRVDADLDEQVLHDELTISEPGRVRPWWETDASVFGEDRARGFRRRD